MQITIDLPDNLALTEPDLRREVAIAESIRTVAMEVRKERGGG
ncbi:hypothetical protein VB780_30080 [Leptolyngbya sp. CCNP1308]|nr:hypothetical protein [Leptolyngbya sp. CCNP1308]MEA5452858.1 hypothetical protein [Leptolyngbya sp. CCNP1308]